MMLACKQRPRALELVERTHVKLVDSRELVERRTRAKLVDGATTAKLRWARDNTIQWPRALELAKRRTKFFDGGRRHING